MCDVKGSQVLFVGDREGGPASPSPVAVGGGATMTMPSASTRTTTTTVPIAPSTSGKGGAPTTSTPRIIPSNSTSASTSSSRPAWHHHVLRRGRFEEIDPVIHCTYEVMELHPFHVEQLARATKVLPRWSAMNVAFGLLASGCPFSVASLRRAVIKELKVRLAREGVLTQQEACPIPLTTDTAALVADYLKDMDESIFKDVFSRELVGDPVHGNLKMAGFWSRHREWCLACKAFPKSFDLYKPLNHCNGCFISVLLAWIFHGYLPALRAQDLDPSPAAPYRGNCRSLSRAPVSVFNDIDRRVTMGWVCPVPTLELISPLTVAVKGHEVARACRLLRQQCPSLGTYTDQELTADWDHLKACLMELPESVRQGYKLKIRVCFNAAPTVNRRMRVRRFAYYEFMEAVAPIEEGYWMFKADLADMFMQIPLHPRARPFFGFAYVKVPAVTGPGYDANEGEILYANASVSFGQNDGPVVANTLSGHTTTLLQHAGIPTSSMTDDFLGSGPSREVTQHRRKRMLDILDELGWITQPEKVSDVLQQLDFLGVTINSVAQTLSLSPERVALERSCLVEVLAMDQAVLTKRDLQSFVGRLNWMSSVMLRGRALNSELYRLAGVGDYPLQRIYLTPLALRDCQAWVALIDRATDVGSKVWSRIYRRAPTAVVRTVSDASSAFGAAIMVKDKAIQFQWDHKLSDSIGAQELLPLLVALLEFGPDLRGQLVVYSTDNSSVAYAINRGSSKSEVMNQMLRRIFELAEQFDVMILADHIPREENILSDAMSKGASYAKALEDRLCAVTI